MTIAACAEITRQGDPDRFLATMAGPVASRERLFPLYAFNVEVARAPWVSSEPLIGEMRLQWWHDCLEEIATAAPVRTHEVATPLSRVLSPGPARELQGLVNARKWDLTCEPFADQGALFAHIDATAGTLAAVGASLCGGPVDAARCLGFAQGAAAWLLAVPEMIARGRNPLPGSPEDCIKALANEGLRAWPWPRATAVPQDCLPVFWTGFYARPVLDRARRNPEAVLSGSLQMSEFRKRLRLIFRQLSRSW